MHSGLGSAKQKKDTFFIWLVLQTMMKQMMNGPLIHLIFLLRRS